MQILQGANYLSIQVVPLVEMTTPLKFDLCFVYSHIKLRRTFRLIKYLNDDFVLSLSKMAQKPLLYLHRYTTEKQPITLDQ